MNSISVHQVKDDIYKYYEQELLKHRREEQVNIIILKIKTNKDNLVEKFAHRLIKWNLELQVQLYIEAQFFSLNYMKYLPGIEHIGSEKGFERFLKVKDWFKSKQAKTNNIKNKVKLYKKLSSDDKKTFSSFKYLNKYEEQDKRLFFNTLNGFELCLNSTTLYNPSSNLCRKCSFKNLCLKVLIKHNKNLFKYRLNVINNNTYIKNIEINV